VGNQSALPVYIHDARLLQILCRSLVRGAHCKRLDHSNHSVTARNLRGFGPTTSRSFLQALRTTTTTTTTTTHPPPTSRSYTSRVALGLKTGMPFNFDYYCISSEKYPSNLLPLVPNEMRTLSVSDKTSIPTTNHQPKPYHTTQTHILPTTYPTYHSLRPYIPQSNPFSGPRSTNPCSTRSALTLTPNHTPRLWKHSRSFQPPTTDTSNSRNFEPSVHTVRHRINVKRDVPALCDKTSIPLSRRFPIRFNMPSNPSTNSSLPPLQRPSIPAGDIPLPSESQEGPGLVMGPVGCELVIHNIDNSNQNPVDIVNQVISTIVNQHPDLAQLPVQVRQTKGQTRQSYVSLKLSPALVARDGRPRPDLLEKWIQPLRESNSDWHVDWALADLGKDKRLWGVARGRGVG